MKVTVTKKQGSSPLPITTEFIKLEAAMKLAQAVTGGMAKAIIQEGQVEVNGETCTMRGKKLVPGDSFTFQGQTWVVTGHAIE